MLKELGIVQWMRIALRLLRGANLLFLIAFIAMLVLSCILYNQLAHQISLRHPTLDAHTSILGLRLLVGVGIIWVLLNDRFLNALLEMTESARLGDPFIPTNVRQLRIIGSMLFAMQLLGIGGSVLAKAFNIPVRANVTPSVAGLLSVLVAFVLAQVFAVGTAMREEQQGTV